MSKEVNRAFKRWIGLAAMVAALVAPGLASASVRIAGTRFVYPAQDKEIVVDVQNEGQDPALLQIWLDSGNANAVPGSEKVPFIVLPPLARIEAGKGQAIRLSATSAGALPQDRESVFYINVLEVPHKVKDGQGKNFMQLAFRSRMKLFYRPEGLNGTPEAAAGLVRWSVVQQGDGYALHAANASDYDVTYTSVKLTAGGKSYDNATGGMVPPHGSLDFPLKGLPGAVGAGEVSATWINDFGSGKSQSYPLSN